ncbi:hypothetical protein C8R44DRAFT_768862 [Mycena epipterygia]|nr:hypothetical protein C8R44DRAFT_768862 [Mycena epipterygia]
MAPSQDYEFAFVCCSIAAVALLIWDHVITFGAEVRKVWCRKFSGATVLYALLRYGTLFEKITVLFLASCCDIAVRVQIFPMILRTLGFGLFSSLRVFALSHKNWPLGLLVFLMCLPAAITPAYVYAHQDSPAVDRNGCQLAYFASATVHDRLRIAGIIADILSETIVIAVTIKRTSSLGHLEVPFEGKKRPDLAMILLRDGTIYFVYLSYFAFERTPPLTIIQGASRAIPSRSSGVDCSRFLNLTSSQPEFATRYDYWVVPYYTPVYVFSTFPVMLNVTLVLSFRTIIICRFLLMLRAVYYDEGVETDGSGDGQSLHFASRVIGSMGAPVDATRFDDDSDIDDEAVVYSGDPFATGLLMMSDTRAGSTRNGKRRAPLDISLGFYEDSPVHSPADTLEIDAV